MGNDVQKYKNLFESLQIGILYQDNKGKITEANRAAIKLTGLTKTQMERFTWNTGKWNAIRQNGKVLPDNEHPASISIKTGKKINNVVLGISYSKLSQNCWLSVNAVPEFRKGEKKPIGVHTTFRDISARIQSEINLKENNEKLRLAFEGKEEFRSLAEESPNMIFINQRGRIVYANKTCEKYTGYKREELFAENFNFMSLIAKEDIPLLKEKFKIHISGKNIPPYEYGLKSKHGKKLDVINSTKIILYKHQPAILGIVTDITERKRIEQDLRESEKRYRYLLNSQNDAVFLHPFNEQRFEKFTEINEIACERYGYSRKEFLELTALELTIDKDIKENDTPIRIKLLKQEGHLVFEMEHIKKSGKHFPVEISSNIIKIKNKQYTLSVIRDITARKRAEKALRKSEERFRNIFEAGQFGITIASPDYKFINANPAFCKMIGYTENELKEKTFADITKPSLIDDSIYKVKALTQGKIKQIKVEKEYVKKNGGVFLGSLISTVVFDENGKVLYYLAMIQDITARKMAGKKQKESLKRIKKINLELEKAKEKAEESDRLKTAFLANMSHEIRTPMNGIMGFSELLRNPDVVESDQQKYIDVIQQSGERMLNIINDLIDISKIEAGQMEIRLERTDLNQLLNSLYTFFKPETNNKNLELIVDINPSLKNIFVSTDKTKLTQILTNLIKNAIKYTDKGQISYGYFIKDENMEFYVKDTGIGIKPEIQDVIFERFRQADQSITKPYEGTGLGLSISKSFIEMLGGEIWLESAPEAGSSFYFSLPYKKVKSRQNMNIVRGPFETNPLLGKVILIAEDDETSFMFLKEVLVKSGIKTLRANNGLEAIDCVKKNPDINLVLMDIKMPVMNGFKATKKIKQLNPQMPVIVQTAFASLIDKQKSFEAGCDDYISKPINKDVLLEMFKKYI